MTITLKKLGASRTQVTAVFTDERAKQAEEAAVKGLGANLKLPGFRPGNAPIPLLRENLPLERIHEETVHILLPEAMKEIQAKGVKPIVTPRVELTALTPLTLTITLVEKPEAKVDVKRVQKGFAEKMKEKKKKSEEKGEVKKEEKADEASDESLLLDLLAEHTKVDLAPELIDEEVRALLEQHARRLEQMGSSLDAWIQQSKKAPQDILTEFRPVAEKRLKIRFGVSTLIEEWKLITTDEEVTQAVTTLLAPLPEEQRKALQSLYERGTEPYEQFRFQKTVEKVLSRLRGS